MTHSTVAAQPATVTTVIDTSAVTPSVPASIYSSARTGNFSYTIPNLAPGAVYSVRLHFAETSTSNANQRRFNVSINGTSVLSNFDIVSVAGSLNKAVVLHYRCQWLIVVEGSFFSSAVARQVQPKSARIEVLR